MYKKIIHFFILSCEKATLLIEKQLHTSLSIIERIQLWAHITVCKKCSAYKYKACFMDKVINMLQNKRENENRFSKEEVDGLKKKFKETIKMNLEQALKNAQKTN